jgi:hypothetical protein
LAVEFGVNLAFATGLETFLVDGFGEEAFLVVRVRLGVRLRGVDEADGFFTERAGDRLRALAGDLLLLATFGVFGLLTGFEPEAVVDLRLFAVGRVGSSMVTFLRGVCARPRDLRGVASVCGFESDAMMREVGKSVESAGDIVGSWCIKLRSERGEIKNVIQGEKG